VIFGRINIVTDPAMQRRFFTAFMEKYAPQDSWGRAKGSFPRIGATIVYAIVPEVMTGKQAVLPSADKRWTPADPSKRPLNH